MADVAASFDQRLGQVIERTATKVGPEVASQLRALVEPQALGIMAAVLVAWVVGHAFAYGEVIDVIIGVVGLIAIGTAIFSGLDEVYEFGRGTYHAGSEADLDVAAEHLAKAIGILGIQAVLAVLFRGRPVTRRTSVGPPPPRTPGLRFRPGPILTDAILAKGSAYCSWWGEINLNAISTGTERAMLIFHERVHQFLTPKLYLLRNVRVEMRVGSYTGSSLYRFLEEWLAYAVGHGRVGQWSEMFHSIIFPVQRGYVYWVKAGSNPNLAIWSGKGIVPEGSTLITTGTMIGVQMQLWFKAGAAALQPPSGHDSHMIVPAR